MHIRRIKATIVVGLLLLMLMLPQLALAGGPKISNVDWEDITSTTARISWTTNTTSTGLVRYGTAIPPTQTSAVTGPGTTHDVTLTGLTPGVKYWFQIESTDSSGTTIDNNSDNYYHFTTVSPATYSITLEPACGVCGELIKIEQDKWVCEEVIKVTAVVAAAGTYYICWDAKAVANVVGTFTATGAGTHTLTFYMPEAIKGPHTVYLVEGALYVERAKTDFTVYPFVKIDPEEGPVGTRVTLNGYGFTNGQQVRIKFNDTIITPTTPPLTAGAKGSWTFNYTIPPTPAGGYIFEVEAKEGTDFWPFANKYFRVIPKITATPDRGTVGQTIEIKGTGFGKDEKNIQVTFDGHVRAAGIVADEKGTWTRTITIPPRQAGTYDIDASGTLTRARDVEEIKFVLEPGILLEPNPAYVGEKIVVSGGGFRPGETNIKVTFGGQVRATVTAADTNGCWRISFVLPSSPYGANTVTAKGDITEATNTLTVRAKIEGVDPNEGAPGDYINLTGSGFNNNKKLTVTIGGVSAAVTDSSRSNGDVVISFRVPKGVAIGKQTLKVSDEGGASAEVDFTVKKKTLPTPSPIAPHGGTIRSGIVTFSWQGITGGSDFTYTYTLEISETPGGSPVRSKPNITGLSYALTKEEALTKKGNYYWRVKVVDNYGNESAWSNSIEFTFSPVPTWVWVVVGLVVLLVLMVVAYRETKFRVTE